MSELTKTLRYLESFVTTRPRPHYAAAPRPGSASEEGPVFGLARLRDLLEAFGRPQDSFPVIHIGGSAGKTSTSTLTDALLRSQGLRSGLHISPHLTTLRERLSVDGAPCSNEQLVTLVKAQRGTIDARYRLARRGPPSYFELLLALALRHFADQEVDAAVLEVGLGGRYDGTNVVQNIAVSIVNCIGLDHTHILGETKEAIARDKLGIARADRPLLSAEQDPAVLAVFEEECAKAGARFELLGRDFFMETEPQSAGGALRYRSAERELRSLRLRAVGTVQQRNAALALRATELFLASTGREFDPEAARAALAETAIPGRCEQLSASPRVILDVAHNPDKLRALAAELAASGRSWQIVLAMTTGKDIEACLEALLPVSAGFFFTWPQTSHRPAEEPLILFDALKELDAEVPAKVFLDPQDALDAALVAASSEEGVCVTGSLFLVSVLRERWRPKTDAP